MRKTISFLIMTILIPIVIGAGTYIFREKRYAFTSMIVTILACVPFFIVYERKEKNIITLILVGVMSAISIVGRLIFAVIPGFKPVTAILIITAIYFGSEAGFMTGALTAVISNFYFGQGPWTPFQMFTWGIIGLAAGLLSEKLKENKILLCVYGAFSGVFFSLVMDIWDVIWWDGYLNMPRYIAMVSSSMVFTILYAVSNVIFLLCFMKPIGNRLERVKVKYGI